jgi:hypothetical protein
MKLILLFLFFVLPFAAVATFVSGIGFLPAVLLGILFILIMGLS